MSIGIIGAGISGLQLALRLQQLGIPVAVHSAQDADGLKSGSPKNFPARFGATQDREKALGVFDWPDEARVLAWSVAVSAPEGPPLTFEATLTPPSSVVDFRLYLPHLFEAFTSRGGEVVLGAPDLDLVARKHDLVVVANGDRSMRDLFPRVPELSPFDGPQRIITTAIYRGIAEKSPNQLDLRLIPGVGEIFQIPFLSPKGRANVLAFEAVPGGPLESVSHLDADADPAKFYREVLALLEQFMPELRERVDTTEFATIGPHEVLQGGVTPTVRKGWATLPNGRCALAIGDAWITNDPLTAQGANLGSYSAFALADLIGARSGPFDESFCRRASDSLWEHAKPVVEWSNAFLAPPPPHVVSLFQAAAADRRVADAFVSNFNDPVAMWQTLSSPAGVDGFLAGFPGGTR
jgi:2-polyprenyl-6-methoxyphenol hydroxylase-like FAD-dependent oxidoreductase